MEVLLTAYKLKFCCGHLQSVCEGGITLISAPVSTRKHKPEDLAQHCYTLLLSTHKCISFYAAISAICTLLGDNRQRVLLSITV